MAACSDLGHCNRSTMLPYFARFRHAPMMHWCPCLLSSMVLNFPRAHTLVWSVGVVAGVVQLHPSKALEFLLHCSDSRHTWSTRHAGSTSHGGTTRRTGSTSHTGLCAPACWRTLLRGATWQALAALLLALVLPLRGWSMGGDRPPPGHFLTGTVGHRTSFPYGCSIDVRLLEETNVRERGGRVAGPCIGSHHRIIGRIPIGPFTEVRSVMPSADAPCWCNVGFDHKLHLTHTFVSGGCPLQAITVDARGHI